MPIAVLGLPASKGICYISFTSDDYRDINSAAAKSLEAAIPPAFLVNATISLAFDSRRFQPVSLPSIFERAACIILEKVSGF